LKNKNHILFRLCFIVVGLTYVSSAFSQDINDFYAVNELSDFYIATPNSTPVKKTKITSAQLFYKQHTGMFKDINQSNALLYVQKNKSRYALDFQNNQEGEFIKRNKAYALYGVHIPISTNYVLSAECNAGFINMSLGDGVSSELDNDFSFDAAVHTILYSKKHLFLLGIEHVNKPVMKPLEYEVNYPIAVYGFYNIKFPISSVINNRSFAKIHYSNGQNAQISIGTMFSRVGIGSLGLSIQDTGDLLFVGDVEVIKTEGNSVNFVFAYEMQNYNKKREYSIPTIQLGLVYK